MRVASVAICALLVSGSAHAAVTKDQFPPRTTGDLIALCASKPDDPLMTAAVNFCQGFAEGAVEVVLGYEAVSPKDHAPFCLPSPPPTHNEGLALFVTWANADPKRLAAPPVVGMLQFLISQYPCPHPVAAPAKKKS